MNGEQRLIELEEEIEGLETVLNENYFEYEEREDLLEHLHQLKCEYLELNDHFIGDTGSDEYDTESVDLDDMEYS